MARKDARAALAASIRSRGDSDTPEADLTDLIADLLIMAHADGMDAGAVARMAAGHFEEETEAYKGRV